MKIGVDIGGTNVKLAVVNEGYDIKSTLTIPTEAHLGIDKVMSNLLSGIERVMDGFECHAIGIGTPGDVDFERGIVRSAGNLPYNNTPISEIVRKRFGIPVLLGNDASCAVLAEARAGLGKKYKNFIMLTLGTGVGGGIVIDGKPYLGAHGAAGEFGHVSIQYDGELCRCGLRGCFENFASVSALIKMTREAAKENRDTILTSVIESAGLNGKTAFLAKEKGSHTASEVIDKYLDNLALGIKNYSRIFDSEAVILAGAITKESDALLTPLTEQAGISVPILISALGKNAGVIGAAALAK